MDLERVRPMANLVLSSDEFVILDIETSGLHPSKGGRIIEIGAVHVKNDVVVGEYKQLIHPEQKIYGKTTELTGITNEMLEKMPNFREVLPGFFEFIKGKVIVAHNAKFDWDRFLVFFFNKVGIEPKNKIVDTLILSKYLFPNEKEHNLGYLVKKYGVNAGEAHRAFDDALATSKILKIFKNLLIQDENFKGTEQLNIFSSAPNNSDSPLNKEDDFKYVEFTIRRVQFWEKSNSVRVLYRRIYLILDIGTIYFDLLTNTWGNKDVKGNIDFKEVEKRLLNSPTKLHQLKGYVTKEMLMGYFGIKEVPKNERNEHYEIKRIKYWEKNNMRRIYITLEEGTVYFDLVERQWGNKNTSKLLNFSALQRDVLKFLGYKELNAFYSFTGDKQSA